MNNMTSFDNKTAVKRMAWILLFLLLLSSFCILACISFKMFNKLTYIVLTIVIVILVLRLATLRYFKLKITDDQVFIKYDYLIIKRYKSRGLKLSWDKIQLQRGILSHYLYVDVSGNRGFYYNLGVLSESSIREIELSLNNFRYNLTQSKNDG